MALRRPRPSQESPRKASARKPSYKKVYNIYNKAPLDPVYNIYDSSCMHVYRLLVRTPPIPHALLPTHACIHAPTHPHVPPVSIRRISRTIFFSVSIWQGRIHWKVGWRKICQGRYVYLYIYIYMGPKFKETHFLLETGCIMHPCTHAPQLFGHAAAATCAGPPDRVNLKATSGMAALERPWPLWSGMAAHCSACTI